MCYGNKKCVVVNNVTRLAVKLFGKCVKKKSSVIVTLKQERGMSR